jgi:hypothetical protein
MMHAFQNDPAVKAMYISRIKAHAAFDEIVQGTYWEEGPFRDQIQHGRGCAVGCTIHSSEHSRYETELGIPRQLAYLQDRIFEGLALADAKDFPLAFLTAIPVGADLSLVMPRFMVWLLSDPEHGTMRLCSESGKEATEAVVALYQRLIEGDLVVDQEWRAVSKLAATAADAAYAAYATAAYATAYAADAAYAAYATAAYATADAAYAAAYAATAAAADAAADAAAYAAADAAARQTHYRRMRDKLLDLLRDAPVPVVQEA